MAGISKAFYEAAVRDAYQRGRNDGIAEGLKRGADDIRRRDREAYIDVAHSLDDGIKAMSQAMNAISTTIDAWRPV